VITTLRLLWALPGTLPGLALAALARATGGTAQRRDGVLEASGGALTRLLAGLGGRALRIEALALGHVILAQNPESLDRWREHEHVHIRQWERWGLFFLPAYAIRSFIAWLKGRDPYRANEFEREAWGDHN
jgi:hypothetical protein